MFSLFLKVFVNILAFTCLDEFSRHARPSKLVSVLANPSIRDPFTAEKNRASGVSRHVISFTAELQVVPKSRGAFSNWNAKLESDESRRTAFLNI